MKKSKTLALAIFCIGILPIIIIGQTKEQKKFTDAIERSESAAKIIKLLASGSDGDMPRELIDSAKAIGVFPKVNRSAALFTHLNQGYGVISVRNENEWTMPAFYLFAGSGYGNPFAKQDTYSVILLFMTNDALDAFEQGAVQFKGEKKAVAGPVGAIDDLQKKNLENAQILGYSYYNGTLKGVDYGSHFFVNPDNKINKPLFGMKGREVLAGKAVGKTDLPKGIAAYKEALEKYCGKDKKK